MPNLTLTVNRTRRTIDIPAGARLIDVLRDQLNLTGAKPGCREGACGSCTVLLDGRPVRSCLTPAASAAGKQVTTIEGMARAGALHPLQQAFLDHEAYQCGYCTPGQICSTLGLLRELEAGVPSQETPAGARPVLSDAEIHERMSGNICRCSAYPQIVAAIRDAAGSMA
ncbi:MAG TPA: (2Fe-2S)-binding protein [Bryobacteraceae bacterium]|nr:(2Fe-2S)-binding protein [Bryobacteraceae bacterium]